VILDSDSDEDDDDDEDFTPPADGYAAKCDVKVESAVADPNAGVAQDENSDMPMTTDDTTKTSEKSAEWLTVWTCDICKSAQFESFAAAVEHEAICTGGDSVVQDAPMKPQDQSSSPPQKPDISKSSINATATTLFSPIISDSSDSKNHELSQYHQLVLESLQLLNHPSGKRIGIGAFHCLFCSQRLHPNPAKDGNAREWTLTSITNELPNTVLSHLNEVCKAAPPSLGGKLYAFKSLNSSGKEIFEKFIQKFFAENGITIVPYVGGMAVLHDDDFMKNPQ
jgi:hypothetical protein